MSGADWCGGAGAHGVGVLPHAKCQNPLILDNLISGYSSSFASPGFGPVFSFSAEGFVARCGAASAGDPAARLSRWRDVLKQGKKQKVVVMGLCPDSANLVAIAGDRADSISG